MSQDEIRRYRREFEEKKREREKAFAEIKGMLEGIRLGKLSSVDKSFLIVVEMMVKGFQSMGDSIISIFDQEIEVAQTINRLRIQVKELETNIQQIRQALHEEFHLFQNR